MQGAGSLLIGEMKSSPPWEPSRTPASRGVWQGSHPASSPSPRLCGSPILSYAKFTAFIQVHRLCEIDLSQNNAVAQLGPKMMKYVSTQTTSFSAEINRIGVTFKMLCSLKHNKQAPAERNYIVSPSLEADRLEIFQKDFGGVLEAPHKKRNGLRKVSPMSRLQRESKTCLNSKLRGEFCHGTRSPCFWPCRPTLSPKQTMLSWPFWLQR